MILAQKGDPIKDNEDEDDEWYMGKFVGLPKPDNTGEWYLGKRFGIKRKGYNVIEEGKVVEVEPLVWRNIHQLTSDLIQTQHIEGIVAVLEICCKIVDDDMTLALSALNALIRMGTGRLDRAQKFGDCGACEYVVTLLHWYGHTSIDARVKRVTPEERVSYAKLVLNCVTVALGAVEVLAAGCKPNREKLGRIGACSYVVEILRRHSDDGKNAYLMELAFNCLWQLSFGNGYNRCRLRESGAENELWRIAHYANASPAQSSRAMAVLGWLKSQMAEDIVESSDPRHVVGGLLLSISEITNSRAKGSPSEAIKLALEGFKAIVRICTTKESTETLDTLIDATRAPEVVVKVTRRIIRHHKRLFRDDVEYLCLFITASCEAINCLLSASYRHAKAGEAAESDNEHVEDYDMDRNGVAAKSKSASNKVDTGEDLVPESMVRAASTDSLASYELVTSEKFADDDRCSVNCVESGDPNKKLSWLTTRSADMMCDAGAVRMLVKELELYIDPHSSHFDKPSKHTHISLQSSNIFKIDPMSILSSGTGALTKGMMAGIHGVKMGISKINDSIQASITKNVSFPDTPEGNCISVISSAIRIMCDISIKIRASFLAEDLPGSCGRLMHGPFEDGITALRTWFLDKVCDDLLKPCVAHSSSWDGLQEDEEYIAMSMALKILFELGGNPAKPFVGLDDVTRTVFIEALNHIGKYISVHGSTGESAFALMEGYERMFMLVSKKILTEYLVMDAWLQVIANIALSRLEAKTKLGGMGACEICLDTLRVHSLRSHVVQRCLWTLCVLGANNEDNLRRISTWNSQTWNADTAQSLLQNVQRSKGQTNEARDHAALILSWIQLQQNMGMSSRKSRLLRQSGRDKSSEDEEDDSDVKHEGPAADKDGKSTVAAVPVLRRSSTAAVPDVSPNENFFNFDIQPQLRTDMFEEDFVAVTEI